MLFMKFTQFYKFYVKLWTNEEQSLWKKHKSTASESVTSLPTSSLQTSSTHSTTLFGFI